mmetsp:Transcript_229/g.573  ORF Transcript_229/g.573 Transcript_229/m.573 type:complete len:227 (-) Transcript_229:451-1131(-)
MYHGVCLLGDTVGEWAGDCEAFRAGADLGDVSIGDSLPAKETRVVFFFDARVDGWGLPFFSLFFSVPAAAFERGTIGIVSCPSSPCSASSEALAADGAACCVTVADSLGSRLGTMVPLAISSNTQPRGSSSVISLTFMSAMNRGWGPANASVAAWTTGRVRCFRNISDGRNKRVDGESASAIFLVTRLKDALMTSSGFRKALSLFSSPLEVSPSSASSLTTGSRKC